MRHLAWLALVVLCACPVARPLEKPRVTPRGAHLASASLAGLELRLDLDIYNPNEIALPLRAIDWEISLDNNPLTRGRIDLSAEIPARATAPVAATATIGPGTAITVMGALRGGVGAARVDATLHFQTAIGEVAVAVSQELLR